MSRPNPLLTEFGIQHRLESWVRRVVPTTISTRGTKPIVQNGRKSIPNDHRHKNMLTGLVVEDVLSVGPSFVFGNCHLIFSRFRGTVFFLILYCQYFWFNQIKFSLKLFVFAFFAIKKSSYKDTSTSFQSHRRPQTNISTISYKFF